MIKRRTNKHTKEQNNQVNKRRITKQRPNDQIAK